MPKIICNGAQNKGFGADAVTTGMQIGGEKMSDDLISRKEAIEAINEAYCTEYEDGYNDGIDFAVSTLSTLPPAQPETSRIEYALHGKSAEEQYDFLYWLMQDYGMQFTDMRVAVIEWLKGERREDAEIH